jgi:hypothetical protein
MANKITIEQRLVILLPLTIGLVWPFLSHVLGNFVMRGRPFSDSFAEYLRWFGVFSWPAFLSLIPFFVLTLYLSAFVKSGTRKISYGALIGGLIGIVVLYIPIEWVKFKPHPGGGVDIGAAILDLFIKPFIAIFTLVVGVVIGKLVANFKSKKV